MFWRRVRGRTIRIDQASRASLKERVSGPLSLREKSLT
jgi:hypothetical protein